MKSFKVGLGMLLVMASAAAASTADAAFHWTPYISEENGAATCDDWDEAARGFGCSGKYCDNARLLCDTLPFEAWPDTNNRYWTRYFSEEHDAYSEWSSAGWYPWSNENYEVCHASSATPGLVTGIDCSGSYCDNLSLECTQIVQLVYGVPHWLGVTNCSWSGWYSEEQGSVDFGWNRFITGVECQGSYCDNKRFHVCSLVDERW
jgi:hypothetical protein